MDTIIGVTHPPFKVPRLDAYIARAARQGCASFEALQDELQVATACGACEHCVRDLLAGHAACPRACAAISAAADRLARTGRLLFFGYLIREGGGRSAQGVLARDVGIETGPHPENALAFGPELASNVAISPEVLHPLAL